MLEVFMKSGLDKIIHDTLGKMRAERNKIEKLRKCPRCKSATKKKDMVKPEWWGINHYQKVCIICHKILLEKRGEKGL